MSVLRPERMSKVSVTGSKRVLDTVIETVHGLNLVHLNDYDESWEGFEAGNSLEGADETAEQLVTVRSIESILGLDEADAAGGSRLADANIADRIDDIRSRVNELDDERNELDGQIRELDEEIEAVKPFAELGIDLDLLSGYDSLDVVVGRGKAEAVDAKLAGAEEIDTYELFVEGRTIAIFAAPVAGVDNPLADALVGVDFTTYEVPDSEKSPDAYIQELEQEKRTLQSKLTTVESRLEETKIEEANFILAAEEALTIEAQKKEAPLSFATTKNAFVAEGWIPTKRFDELESALDAAVGDSVLVEELEIASFGADGSHAHTEHVTDSGESVATDGGHATEADTPPVVQKSPTGVRSFELLTEAVSRPKYKEFDPTILVFLTFPLMFGFMIGDVGYGALYLAIGYFMYSNYESAGIKSLGGVAMWAGAFTVLFGFLYDEVFGLHLHDYTSLVSQPLPEYVGIHYIHKGIYPGDIDWAIGWLVVSVLFGVLHLNIGYVLQFFEDLEFHGVKDAVLESGSWILMLNGLWVWIFSDHVRGSKPDFLFETFAADSVGPLAIGFSGFTETIGLIGLGLFGLGVVLLALASLAEAIEFLNVLVNGLSYTRIAAVLLAKAGMALAVNLLAFGAYLEDGSYYFLMTGSELEAAQAAGREVVFPGLITSGSAAGLIGGLLVLIFGHIIVLALGITSAGLQAIRLEYVEFFGKFFDGGGDEYDPFGYERQYSSE
ncbi:V-type ATP synthase subunit I [Halalkalirubrum salinum]|uniref:V-type ATP synthase subunit I n=1 Tax=Halalkalirubrum salinum TaxID=2563889 RepID=UPI001F0E78DA|nr:V-type ATP synthase subunit I [Halalkalirubrum salinum]